MKRIYHTWDQWECYPAGFYEERPPRGLTKEAAEQEYAAFLRDTPRFAAALSRVLNEWPRSCEHYLSNENMNRIAWLGQASACLAEGLPSVFRGGFNRLTDAEQATANDTALTALNEWLHRHGEPTLTIETASSRTQANLY
jgi:hypothetical protein